MEDDIKIIKSRKFANRIIKLYQFLGDKNIEDIRRQVLRSGSSIGANIAESVFSESRIDFKHKISIALKKQMRLYTGLRCYFMAIIFQEICINL